MDGPVAFGRYVLLEQLALGGMAEIFLAKAVGEAGFEKAFVVKRVLPHLTLAHGFVEMFLDEARIAAQLNHPGIVQIFDLGKQDGDYYFAMEYLAGEDVSAVVRRCEELGRRIPVDVAVKIAAAAAEALHYAHRYHTPDGRPLGIVHRDISPSNLFVTYHGTVKVLDFGIARAEQRLQQTRAGHIKGKAAYMAPEQARGEQVDARADVWALGVCLHEMLTGRRLFLRDSSGDTLLAVREGPIPRPRELRPEIPVELDALIMQALERDVSRRCPSADVLRTGLDR
jgi:serine/threonine protein kinase